MMIGQTQRQSSLFFAAFGREAARIRDETLEAIEELIDDTLVLLVRAKLETRFPQSGRTGRPGIAPDRLLRCCILKHVKGWSFRELEQELRCSLVYRRFTRFDADPTPTYSTLSRVFGLLGKEVAEAIHRAVVGKARATRVAKGRKLRTDTTVVESNVHYPTDSSLLADGVRVLTRHVDGIAKNCRAGSIKVRQRKRAVQRRVLEINRAAKSAAEPSRERLKSSYRKLLVIARSVARLGERVSDGLKKQALPIVGDAVAVLANWLALDHYLPLMKKVIEQATLRVFGGDTHVPEKVLSLFEPHTVAIRKGKAHKPTEFGRLVRIDEVENNIVSNYEVLVGNPADTNAWPAALSQHQWVFGRPPHMATADRGYFSAKNEADAIEQGVQRVALPARGHLSKKRAALQKTRWFRRALRWRAGIEARISTLKHPFSMARAFYKGEDGFARYVGWCVITHNLVSLGRTLALRKRKKIATR